jgi:hypothetical protein
MERTFPGIQQGMTVNSLCDGFIISSLIQQRN